MVTITMDFGTTVKQMEMVNIIVTMVWSIKGNGRITKSMGKAKMYFQMAHDTKVISKMESMRAMLKFCTQMVTNT